MTGFLSLTPPAGVKGQSHPFPLGKGRLDERQRSGCVANVVFAFGKGRRRRAVFGNTRAVEKPIAPGLRGGGGLEDEPLVGFQTAEPSAHVGGMVVDMLARHTEAGTELHRADFCNEFFLGCDNPASSSAIRF